MKKKQYLSPKVMVYNISCRQSMLAGSGETITYGTTDGGNVALSRDQDNTTMWDDDEDTTE